MKLLNKYWYIVLTCCSINFLNPVIAQDLKGKFTVKEKQYHQIDIPQSFRSIIASDIGKIRIKNSKGTEIPFILKTNTIASQEFLKVAHNIVNSDTSQIITIENTSGEKREDILIKIANSTGAKLYKIEGSDDNLKWYNVVNKATLKNLQDESQTFVNKRIEFPKNQYRYLKIIIDNKSSAALNILDVGKIINSSTHPQYEVLDNVKFTNVLNTKSKTSNIVVSKNGYSPVDQIEFQISNPKDYNREMELFYIEEQNTKGKKIAINQNNQIFYLNSVNSQKLDLQLNTYPEKFNITIHNEDNIPLDITAINLYQQKLSLIAYVEPNETYSLEADKNWDMPNYDLNNIDLKLPIKLSKVAISNIETIQSDSTENKDSLLNSKWILIICSILGVAIVFYFGGSILKDMKKNS